MVTVHVYSSAVALRICAIEEICYDYDYFILEFEHLLIRGLI